MTSKITLAACTGAMVKVVRPRGHDFKKVPDCWTYASYQDSIKEFLEQADGQQGVYYLSKLDVA